MAAVKRDGRLIRSRSLWDIERDNVAAFKGLYEKYHKRFPRVSKVFKDLYEQYERMAKEMDDEAELTKLDY